MTGDRSALRLEANANYFRENLFHRASLCWLGRKDQIYSPRLSHLASFTFLSLLLPGFCFFCFPPRPIVLVLFQWLRKQESGQLESGTATEQFWGAGLRWAPNSQPQLLSCAQSLVAQSCSHQCHHPQLLLAPQGQVFQTPLPVLYKDKVLSSALLMGNNHISEASDVRKGTGGNCFFISLV